RGILIKQGATLWSFSDKMKRMKFIDKESLWQIILRDTSKSSSLVQEVLFYKMYNWNTHELDVMGETDIIVNTRDVCCPDACIQPQQRRQPPQRQAVSARANSTMVIEIGGTESLNSLHELATGYFSPRTNIQISHICIAQANPTVPYIAKSFGTANLHISTTRFPFNIPNFPANNITGVGCGQVACDGSTVICQTLNSLLLPTYFF
ncbi:1965_t:CDS:2, partial [Acaulospora morrowiae]